LQKIAIGGVREADGTTDFFIGKNSVQLVL